MKFLTIDRHTIHSVNLYRRPVRDEFQSWKFSLEHAGVELALQLSLSPGLHGESRCGNALLLLETGLVV